jgi:anti-sigma regulatory factor (Ser/Thr protein kinase)
MSEFKCSLTVSGTVADLPRVSEFVEDACEQSQVYPAARFDLQLAVEEACCNVIDHAYNSNGGEFRLQFEARGPDIVITVQDRGRPFDPTLVPSPDMSIPLEERPLGGLGLHLMRQLMDDVQFTFSDEGNTLKMVKRGVVWEGLPQGSEAQGWVEEAHA